MAITMASLSDGKHADPELALAVDEMILDYQLYVTITKVIEEFEGRRDGEDVDLSLQLVDSFLPDFKARYKAEQCSSHIKLRLQLLQFATVFMRRYEGREIGTPSPAALQKLRSTRRHHADSWMDRAKAADGSLPAHFDLFSHSVFNSPAPIDFDLVQNRQREALIARGLPEQQADFHYGGDACVSLLDTLPSFMALSASAVHGTDLSIGVSLWMNLAAEYISKAVIEQYQVFASQGPQPLKEAFAWGYIDLRQEPWDRDEETVKINELFYGDGKKSIPEWERIRDSHLQALIPPHGVPLDRHLDELSEWFTVADLEGDIIGFLRGLLTLHPKPILMQLEEGQLDEMTVEETEAFKKTVGI
ncbi:MAG: hypothetical protein M4579_005469 [Chaenotheca gracillima]|nr:MAG: hypothetical protein M4579_005469 [Chaenotheca gracillima]